MQALHPAVDSLLSNNLPYHSFVFYRKGKDLSSITRQVSTIKLIHPFYDTPVFQTDGVSYLA